MIQRIQSLYLLFAIILIAIVFLAIKPVFPQQIGYVGLVILAGITSAVSLFLFKQRRKQMKLICAAVIELCAAIVVFCIAVYVQKDTISWSSCSVIVLSVVAILFNYLAWRAVRRDEMKVKSADRIR